MPGKYEALFVVDEIDQGASFDTQIDAYPPIPDDKVEEATQAFGDDITTEFIDYPGYPDKAVQRISLHRTEDYPEATVRTAVDGLRRIHEAMVNRQA